MVKVLHCVITFEEELIPQSHTVTLVLPVQDTSEHLTTCIEGLRGAGFESRSGRCHSLFLPSIGGVPSP